jgi:hypothetical protein
MRWNYSTTRRHFGGQKRISTEISNKERVAWKTCIKLNGTFAIIRVCCGRRGDTALSPKTPPDAVRSDILDAECSWSSMPS